MKAMILAALVAGALHAAVWAGAGVTVVPPDAGNRFDSLSFSPFAPGQDAESKQQVSPEQIDADLATVKAVTDTVRLYASSHGLDLVPEIAREHGLQVTVGAWLSGNVEEDKAEIERVIKLANSNSNVRTIHIGNEVLLRKDLSVDQLISYIRQVKRRVSVPVTTGEVWNVWLEYPQLAREVDLISAHLLPYWQGIRADAAVQVAFDNYDMLRSAFPGKKISVGEFGWPSQGFNNLDAEPGAAEQAEVVRAFMREAHHRGVEYNIIEAFDQPWKTMEGSVGAYWGVFDADRRVKFELQGPVSIDYRPVAALGLVIGLLLTWSGLRRRNPTLAHGTVYALASNGLAAGLALAVFYPFSNYINVGTGIMWAMGVLMVVPLTVMTLAKVNEIGDVLLGRRPKRLIQIDQLPRTGQRPKVSIHIPAYKEPAEMLNHTLDSVAALDYPNWEALVIINNTTEEKYWKPVEAHIEMLNSRLGAARFKFVYLPKVVGFKAGALTAALRRMDPDAAIIAVIDADYAVDRSWLKDLVPAFDNPKVALVQAPQDHRDGKQTLLKTMMNWEYAGFFDIGMVQRNEDNAIVAHGTMLLLRRSAFEQVGGWSWDTIVEDTELGLRLFEAGWEAGYTNRRYGWGLLPDTFKAFKTQRNRWAYGAIQIIKKHWRHMLPGSRTLSPAQKSQFVSGWVFWLSDALGVAIAIMNLIWVPIIIVAGMTLPMMALTVPILTAFAVNVLHCVLLYRKRVEAALPEILGAAVAAMSLQLTVGQAVLSGLIKDSLPFVRTDKGGNAQKKKGDQNPVFWETVLGLLLLVAATLLVATNTSRIIEQDLFAATIAIQGIPFLMATLMHAVEKHQNAQTARKAAHAPVIALPTSDAGAG